MRFLAKPFLFTLLITAVLAGCAKEPPPRVKVYWPPPPAEPKMEWITTYVSEDSFEKSGQQLATENFLGKPELHFFAKPSGVASRGDGVVYVSDLDAAEVRVIDFNQKTSSTYSENTPVAMPLALAFDSKGALYVADAKNKNVVKFNTQRQVVGGYGAGELERPTFLALDEAGNRLYVSDVIRHEVLVFDLTSGEKLFSFGGRGAAPGKLFGPQGLAIDREGKVYVAEQLNARVQVFDKDGKPLYMFGKRGDRDFDFEAPRGLAFDSAGNLFVADARKSVVMIFLPDGTPLSYLGGGGTQHALDLTMPTAIYIDPNDRLYICDALMNRRVVIWQMLTPDYLAKHPLDRDSLQRIEGRVRTLQEKD